MSKIEKLNLIPLRGGKYPTTTKITDGTANSQSTSGGSSIYNE